MSFADRLRDTSGYPVAVPTRPVTLQDIEGINGGEASNRFAAYLERMLRDISPTRKQFPTPPETTDRLTLDQLVVKLAQRLHRETAMAGSPGERVRLLLDFSKAMEIIELVRLEIDPPELVRRVIERVAVSTPAPVVEIQESEPDLPTEPDVAEAERDMSGYVTLGDSAVGPVTVSLRARCQGLYVVGKNGMGKSTFLLSLIQQDLLAGRGVAVLDPHGSLVNGVLAMLPPEREEDVVIFDVTDTAHPFAFDLFTCPNPDNPAEVALTSERIIGIFKKQWGEGIGPRSQDLLDNAIQTLIANPGSTLADMPRLLTDERYRQRLVQRVDNRVVSDYWLREFDPMRDAGQNQVRAPLLNKVRGFLRHPIMQAIVSQSGGVDFAELIENRGILLIRLDARMEEATSLLGSSMVSRLLEVVLGRRTASPTVRPPFMLYADEYQRFVTPDFDRLLQEARKFGLATTIAHQKRSQLDAAAGAAATGAVNMVFFQLDPKDARELSQHFLVPPEPSAVADDPAPISTISSRGYADPEIVNQARMVTAALEEAKAFFVQRRRQEGLIPDMVKINYQTFVIRNFLESWAYKVAHNKETPSLDPTLDQLLSAYALDARWPDLLAAAQRIGEVLRDELEPHMGQTGTPTDLSTLAPYSAMAVYGVDRGKEQALIRPKEVVTIEEIEEVASALAGERPLTPRGKRSLAVRDRSRFRTAGTKPETQDPVEDEAVFYKAPPPGSSPD